MAKPVVTTAPPINMKFCVVCKKLEGTCEYSLYGVRIVSLSDLATQSKENTNE